MASDLTPHQDRSSLPQPFGPVRAQMNWDDRGDDAPGLDFAALIRIVRENYKLILATLAAGIAAAIAITLMTKPLYRADVVLEVNPPQVEILDEQRRSTEASIANWDYLMTQVGLLESRSLAERVVQDHGLATDPQFVAQEGNAARRVGAATSRVAGGIRVTPPEQGQLIEVSYIDEDPRIAAKVANGIADSFIDASLSRRFDASNHAREFLQGQIDKSRKDLEESEKKLVEYAQAQGIINTSQDGDGNTPSDANSLQGESLIALNRALAEATARRVAAEGAYRQARLAGNSSDVAQSTSGLRSTKAALEAEYRDKRTLMKPDHPDMVALQSRIDELGRQINSEQSRLASGKATSLLAEFRAAQSAESALRARVNSLRGSVLDLRGRSIQYNILKREVDTNRGLYDALLQRYKEVGVAGRIGTAPVSIIDRADVPKEPYSPNLFKNLLAGLFAGLLLGVLIAVVREFIYDVVKTREDVRVRLGQACLGVVPRRNGKGGTIVDDLRDPSSAISEAYSGILASLRFSTEHGAPKALLITSSAPAEGKSSSAFALAQNYARRGETVLLIDADLRRPVFKAHSNRQGLTKLLTNDDPLRAHLLDTQFENLWLLPCGPTPPNPADLLSTQRFAALLAEASEQFDRIIVDGPPVVGLADAALLATSVNQVAVVVEAGKTRTRVARQAIDQVLQAGAHVTGVILTKSSEEASTYGYRVYRYNRVEDNRDDMILISDQAGAE